MKENKEPKIEQPTINEQQIYLSLVSNDPTEVQILRTNKKYKVRWLKNAQLEKISRLLIHKKSVDEEKTTGSEVLDEILEDTKLACKAAAIILLDGYWKLTFFYWIVWRWFYYIEQYDNMQLDPLLQEGKKKVPQMQFFKTIMSLTEAKDTLMRMRAREVESILHAPNMEQPSATESNDSGS